MKIWRFSQRRWDNWQGGTFWNEASWVQKDFSHLSNDDRNQFSFHSWDTAAFISSLKYSGNLILWTFPVLVFGKSLSSTMKTYRGTLKWDIFPLQNSLKSSRRKDFDLSFNLMNAPTSSPILSSGIPIW